jgi:phage portal protein BeeE
MLARYGDTFWEGEASGAAVLLSSYGSPNREKILPGLAGHAVSANAANSPVFSASVKRIRLFAEASFVLRSVSDKRIFTDQRLSLLQHPWPDATEGELLARMEQDAIMAGNSYTWAPPDEDVLVRFRPDWVTIISELVSVPSGGWYRRKIGFHFEPPRNQEHDFGPPVTVPAEEVAHWAPLPDPQANFRGMSPLTPIIREIDADSGMTGYKLQYLNNAASPNLLIKYSQKLQPGTVDSLRERITARYGGQSNAFRTLILDQGADATVIGANFNQMNFDTVQQAGADRILAALEVPGILLGLVGLQGAGKSYGDVMRQFADTLMRPEWRSACAALQKLVPGLPPAGVKLWFDTSDIAALQDGEQEKAQESLIRAQALLTFRNSGYTRDSAVLAVLANDVSQLVVDPDAPPPVQPPGAAATQHMLPQPPGSGPGPTVVEGVTPRLNAAPASPGSGEHGTQAAVRPASVRRALNGAPRG